MNLNQDSTLLNKLSMNLHRGFSHLSAICHGDAGIGNKRCPSQALPNAKVLNDNSTQTVVTCEALYQGDAGVGPVGISA